MSDVLNPEKHHGIARHSSGIRIILSSPFATPRRAFFTVIGVYLWTKLIPCAVSLSHADWKHAIRSFMVWQ